MSALPCPVADPFVAADQFYATITEFLRSKEACQVKHSELERQLEGMSRELIRKLLQAHLELRQPGQAVEPVRDAAGTPLTPTSVQGAVWRASLAPWRWPAPATEPPAHPVCIRWTVRSIFRRRSVLAGGATPGSDGKRPRARSTRG